MVFEGQHIYVKTLAEAEQIQYLLKISVWTASYAKYCKFVFDSIGYIKNLKRRKIRKEKIQK